MGNLHKLNSVPLVRLGYNPMVDLGHTSRAIIGLTGPKLYFWAS